jgi:DNA-binding NarL/FixJ family response regulator
MRTGASTPLPGADAMGTREKKSSDCVWFLENHEKKNESMTRRSTRILLAEDHFILLTSLNGLLSRQEGFEIVGEARDGLEAAALAQTHKPDVVVMDVLMPVLDGFEATRRILAQDPGASIIALSAYADRSIVARAVDAGALGYVLKESSFEELVDAILTVREKQPYFCGGVKHIFNCDNEQDILRRLHRAALTEREREVLKMISEGFTTRQMADKLKLSSKTVDAHRRKIMAKLNLHTVPELTKYAIRHGLTKLEL